MPNYQTIVIQYDGDEAPFLVSGQKVNDMKIIAISMKDEIKNNINLEEKLAESNHQLQLHRKQNHTLDN